jgi:hypothetical protein
MEYLGPLVAAGLKLVVDSGFRTRVLRFFRRRRRILVLGASGVGKTAFVRSLSGDPLRAGDLLFPTHTTVRSHVGVSEVPFVIADTPGHQLYRGRRREAALEGARRPYDAVVNVVAYGYHQVERPGDGVLCADGTRPRAAFLRSRRATEIEQVLEWRDVIAMGTARRVVTLVNKADLWAPSDMEVMRYYEEGPYKEALGELAGKLPHTVLPYCSVIQTFYDGVTSGRFGDRERAALQAYFLATLLDVARHG